MIALVLKYKKEVNSMIEKEKGDFNAGD